MRHGWRGRTSADAPVGTLGGTPVGPLVGAILAPWRAVLALALGIVALTTVACSGGEARTAGAARPRPAADRGDPSAASGTATSTTEGTGAPAAAGEASGAGRPALVVRGDDLEAVIRSMLAVQDWSLRHPDPSLPERWITPGSPCLEIQRETHRYLREHHGRAETARVVESVRILDRPDRHHALLEVRDRSLGARTWTDDAPIPETVGPSGPGTAVYTLTRDPATTEWRMSRAGCTW